MLDLEMARKFGAFDDISTKLAEAFWPGPLTMVVPRLENTSLHPLAFAGLDTIGIRCPTGPAQKVIDRCQRPLAAPSANKSGKISPTTAQNVASQFEDTDLMILDNGACRVGLESTILKVEDENITILRPGFVTEEQIFDVTGIKPALSTSGKIEAPGMMKSHYAPNANVKLNCFDLRSRCRTIGVWEP
ncbi:Threonylcarbamoyl-AMP synthase [Nymphon striatum]|nr:Threonylcarbamoyl-AMP synthase [Nymphon striatum]